MCDSMGWRKQPGDEIVEMFTKIFVNRFKNPNNQKTGKYIYYLCLTGTKNWNYLF